MVEELRYKLSAGKAYHVLPALVGFWECPVPVRPMSRMKSSVPNAKAFPNLEQLGEESVTAVLPLEASRYVTCCTRFTLEQVVLTADGQRPGIART